MKYKISKHEVIKEDGVAVRELLTLEVTYADESTSTHGFVVPEGKDIKEFAVECAAELEKILVEPVEVTTEEVEVKAKDKEVKKAEVLAKIEADEAIPTLEEKAQDEMV